MDCAIQIDLVLTFVDSLRPPAIQETTQTAGRKSNKKKTPKKGAKEEDEDTATATDGTIPSSPLNADDLDELKKEDGMLEHGVAPLPEGVNAEGQAINPPVKLENGEEKKGKGKAKAKAATTPKKKAATPRKRKVKEEVSAEEGVDGEDVKPVVKKARKPRTPKAKKVEEPAPAPAPEVKDEVKMEE